MYRTCRQREVVFTGYGKQADFVLENAEATNGNFEEFEKRITHRVKIEVKRGSLPLAFQLLMLVEGR